MVTNFDYVEFMKNPLNEFLFRYDAIFKLETLNEDTYYIKNKLDINLDVHLQR